MSKWSPKHRHCAKRTGFVRAEERVYVQVGGGEGVAYVETTASTASSNCKQTRKLSPSLTAHTALAILLSQKRNESGLSTAQNHTLATVGASVLRANAGQSKGTSAKLAGAERQCWKRLWCCAERNALKTFVFLDGWNTKFSQWPGKAGNTVQAQTQLPKKHLSATDLEVRNGHSLQLREVFTDPVSAQTYLLWGVELSLFQTTIIYHFTRPPNYSFQSIIQKSINCSFQFPYEEERCTVFFQGAIKVFVIHLLLCELGF